MLYPSIDELKKRSDSRYTLVMMASKRARDLIDGYPALVDIGIHKPVSIATEEIARDMISYTRNLRPETGQEASVDSIQPMFDGIAEPVFAEETDELLQEETSLEEEDYE